MITGRLPASFGYSDVLFVVFFALGSAAAAVRRSDSSED